jgi:hypothetical protein
MCTDVDNDEPSHRAWAASACFAARKACQASVRVARWESVPSIHARQAYGWPRGQGGIMMAHLLVAIEEDDEEVMESNIERKTGMLTLSPSGHHLTDRRNTVA